MNILNATELYTLNNHNGKYVYVTMIKKILKYRLFTNIDT